MTERILVRIDFQNDFVDPEGKLTVNDIDLINRHHHFNQSLQRGMFTKILDVADTHFEETYALTKEAESYGIHTVYNSWGWHKAAEFKDNIHVANIYKSSTNLWNEEKNYPLLQQNWSGKEIFLCGLLSDMCIHEAMDGFLSRGAKVTLFEDLCKGAKKQLPEIIREGPYCSYLEAGRLRLMTSGQFFRMILNEKKQQYNLVKRGKEI